MKFSDDLGANFTLPKASATNERNHEGLNQHNIQVVKPSGFPFRKNVNFIKLNKQGDFLTKYRVIDKHDENQQNKASRIVSIDEMSNVKVIRS